MTHGPILIIGGGIAGPAAAIALARAGVEATIYEASAMVRDDGGAFFNLAPNGLAVLRALGVDGIAALGFRNDRLVFHNERGRVLAETAVGGVTMMRGALSRRLREAAEDLGVRVVHGKTLDAVREAGAGGVVASFTDGTSTAAAALIGADGLHSATRASILPAAPRPAYTGILNLGGVVRTDLPPTGDAMHMIFGRRAFFGYAVRPGGETYWFSNYAQRSEPARQAVLAMEADTTRARLIELHRDDPPEVGRILGAIRGAIGAYPIYDLPPLRTWHRGCACLIGDAAHAIGPHVGQGVSLALEDAYVVATCLRESPEATTAFAAFEAQRRGRVVPVVKQSRRTGKQKAPSGWLGRQLRDLMLPMFLRMAATGAQELYRWTPPAWDQPVGEVNG